MDLKAEVKHLDDKLFNLITIYNRTNLPERFLETENYKDLKAKFPEKQRILLKGPKGCGKSTSLIAVLNDFKSSVILYVTSTILNSCKKA